MLKKIAIALVSLTCLSSYAKEIRVGVSLPTQRDIGWVRYREAFEDAAKKQHVTLFMQVADQNPAEQVSQVENLLSQKIDVLIIAPQDASAASSLVKEAHKAGIKVICIDRLIMNSKVDMYVAFDNVKIGALQGEYLTKIVPNGNYILLSGAPTDNNSKMLKKGNMEYVGPLVKNGHIKVVMDQFINDWQPSDAERLVENALTANKNNVQAVLAPNDNTAGGVIQALAAQKLAGKVIVTGQDAEVTAAQRILAGTQAMTIFKDQRKLSDLALQTAISFAENKPVPTKFTTNNGKTEVPSLLLTPVVVDKKNIDAQLIKTGYLKKEDVYRFKR